MKAFLAKHKAVIRYLFFGALTTAVNVAVYTLLYGVLGVANVPSTAAAWAAAVAFAFVTNKLFVFESRSWRKNRAFREAGSFVLCRFGSGLVELAVMFVFVDLLGVNGAVMKLLTNVVTVILNYVASRLVIFREPAGARKREKLSERRAGE